MSEHLIAKNKRAHFDYEILETFEAGLVLTGPEIKSIRAKEVSINEAFVLIRKQEAFIINMNVKKYEFSTNIAGVDPTRTRKLLLNKREIKNITKRVKLERLTIVPIKLYLKDNYAKLEIGIGRGKKSYDKRESIKERDIERKTNATFKRG
ncbi:SsrA-binding protein SmpB [Mesoplasma photuris]|uniref:SsrA-binding protein SmpB n=1 Tax=Mesoplasma photuris TaxID=217731 RepID=UPI0004E1DB7C|nr:SsrA-binding protein SmpB [Mesoplasma photuris]